MDRYPPAPRRTSNPDRFTLTIGASGHNPTDLNSYVAVEFDFLGDVLEAVRRVEALGADIRVVIKVRPNGYRKQYEQFAAEYFPGIVDEIVDQTPMRDVLARSDFFISIFSQTLFEASCMGIPVLYYRVGDVYKDPPFDGRSELVTVDDVADMVQALNDFRSGHPRYAAFLDRDVMERYIGPLDGRNLERNLAFVYELLDHPRHSLAS
jgi:CDP-glycerol glycerophosphotransferase (TagB/SpsB family)